MSVTTPTPPPGDSPLICPVCEKPATHGYATTPTADVTYRDGSQVHRIPAGPVAVTYLPCGHREYESRA